MQLPQFDHLFKTLDTQKKSSETVLVSCDQSSGYCYRDIRNSSTFKRFVKNVWT